MKKSCEISIFSQEKHEMSQHGRSETSYADWFNRINGQQQLQQQNPAEGQQHQPTEKGENAFLALGIK